MSKQPSPPKSGFLQPYGPSPSRHTSVLSLNGDLAEADMTYNAMTVPPTQGEASDTIQKLNYKLMMQKAHYEKQLTTMKLRVTERDAELKTYRDIVEKQNNDARHTTSLAEARQLTVDAYEKQNASLMELIYEVDPELKRSVERLYEVNVQVSENPTLAAKLPTAKDLGLEYKKKHLGNISQQRRTSLEKSNFSQLPAGHAKKNLPQRKRSVVVDKIVKSRNREQTSGESKQRPVPVQFSPSNSLGDSMAQSQQSPLLEKEKSVRIVDHNEASQGSFRQTGGSFRQSALGSFRNSFVVFSPTSPHRGTGARPGSKGLTITPSRDSTRVDGHVSFNGKKYKTPTEHMQLDTFIDYNEMEEVNKARNLQKAQEKVHLKEMAEIETENERLRRRYETADARYLALRARENALRRDFDKMVARTLTHGITGGGIMGGTGPSSAHGSHAGATLHSVYNKNTSGNDGSSGSFTARTRPQAGIHFEMPDVKGATKQGMVVRGADGIETLNTPRFPEITSKVPPKGPIKANVKRKQDDGPPPISKTSPKNHSKASPPRDGVSPLGDVDVSLTPTKKSWTPNNRSFKEMAEAGEMYSSEGEITPNHKALVLESRTPPLITPPPPPEYEEKVNSRGEFQVSESQVKVGKELAANVPRELPSAPWIPTKVEHVDTTKTGPAFRILLSCYVHDLCNLVRVVQPAQDTLFKESRELQDYMLGLWNGETPATGLICPPSNLEMNFLNLEEIVPSFSSNAVVKQLRDELEKKDPDDRWHEEVELLQLSWRSLTASLQQNISHFQQQIGVWRRTQLVVFNEHQGVPKNIFRSQLLGPSQKTKPKKAAPSSPRTFDPARSNASSFNSLDGSMRNRRPLPQSVTSPFSSKEEPSNEAAEAGAPSLRKANSQVTIVA